jgi:peptidyl-prolyl cis-trans isomerase B (cyclophilin B)
MPRRLLLLAALLALVLAGCGGSKKAAKPTTTAKAAAPAQQVGCRKVGAPAPRPAGHLPKPKLVLDPAKTYRATLQTSCGDFTITLDSKRAPRTGGSFVSLVRRGFYDGLTFHRVISGFVIQGGDPRGNGRGGPGYQVVEPPPDNLRYTRGVVAMAKTELEKPGTSGSQFYVVTGEDAQLPPQYALLGKVTSGGNVVQRIGAVPTGQDDRPVDPVVIDKITVAVS